MDLIVIPIPQALRSIIEDMRGLIAKNETDHSKIDPTGWQHGGPDFITLVENFEKEMNKQGFHVSMKFLFQKSKLLTGILGVGLRQHSATFFQRRKYPEPLLSHETIVDNSHQWNINPLTWRPIATRYLLLHQRSTKALWR